MEDTQNIHTEQTNIILMADKHNIKGQDTAEPDHIAISHKETK